MYDEIVSKKANANNVIIRVFGLHTVPGAELKIVKSDTNTKVMQNIELNVVAIKGPIYSFLLCSKTSTEKIAVVGIKYLSCCENENIYIENK